MCGIIAYTGKRQAVDMLLAGLFHLEYRGYDSSGIAVLGKNKIELRKKKGKVEELKKVFSVILCLKVQLVLDILDGQHMEYQMKSIVIHIKLVISLWYIMVLLRIIRH